MSEDFTLEMKEKLIEAKKEILKQLSANNNDFEELLNGLEGDSIDIAADDIDRKTLQALGTQSLNRMKLIDNALARIEQGKYGLCMSCGKRIPQERLEAIPYALMCIECKSKKERRR